MLGRKVILWITTYCCIILGIPFLLLFVIGHIQPKENALNSWRVQTWRVVLAPNGLYWLPPSSAVVAQTDRVTLLTYPRLEQPDLKTDVIYEQSSFSTLSGRRYSLRNDQKKYVEVILVTTLLPGMTTIPTPTLDPPLSKGYSATFLDERYLDRLPTDNELRLFAQVQARFEQEKTEENDSQGTD
ncbi:MAG TPA: hypothetical protein VH186_32765 [Chloroflexia bacterium]|nr:hypothetical protein [Chloroflexia bacterium]